MCLKIAAPVRKAGRRHEPGSACRIAGSGREELRWPWLRRGDAIALVARALHCPGKG